MTRMWRCDISGNSRMCRSTRENMEAGREQDYGAFNAWKYRHYFEFHAVKNGKNISVL